MTLRRSSVDSRLTLPWRMRRRRVIATSHQRTTIVWDHQSWKGSES